MCLFVCLFVCVFVCTHSCVEMCRGNVEEAEIVWKKLENSLSDFEGIS